MTIKPHECSKSADIALIKQSVDKMDHVINGNGKKGLRDEVTILSEATTGLRADLNDFRVTLSAMQRFMTEIQTEKLEKEKANLKFRWIIGTAIVIAMFLFGSGILK